jgi:hypothetical protein
MAWRQGAALAGVAGVLAACASTPRDYVPRLAAEAGDPAAYAQTFDSCRTAVASGQRRNFGSSVAGSVGAGAAATAGGAAATSAAVLAAGATVGEAALIGALLLPYMLVLAPVGAFGYSRAKRSRKETEIKHAMELCLLENGYRVSEWSLVKPAPGARTEAPKP